MHEQQAVLINTGGYDNPALALLYNQPSIMAEIAKNLSENEQRNLLQTINKKVKQTFDEAQDYRHLLTAEIAKKITGDFAANEDLDKELTWAQFFAIFQSRKFLKELKQKKTLAQYAAYHSEALKIVLSNKKLRDIFLKNIETEKHLTLYVNTEHNPDDTLDNYFKSKNSSATLIYKEKSEYPYSKILLGIIQRDLRLGKVILNDPVLAEKISAPDIIPLAHQHPEIAAMVVKNKALYQQLPFAEKISGNPCIASKLAGAVVGFSMGVFLHPMYLLIRMCRVLGKQISAASATDIFLHIFFFPFLLSIYLITMTFFYLRLQ